MRSPTDSCLNRSAEEICRLKDRPVAGRGFPECWRLKTLVRGGFRSWRTKAWWYSSRPRGLQILENKGLVVFEPSIMFPKFRATHVGVEAVEQDAVARIIRRETTE
jgi:hypothetical protein